MPQILVFALFFAGVYFLLLRPQQQRVRRQRELISAIGVGDRVVTAGGLVGRVVDESDDRLLLEVADGVVVEFLRLAISRRLDESESAFAFSGVAAGEEEAAEEEEEEAAADSTAADAVAAAGSSEIAPPGEAEVAPVVDPAPEAVGGSNPEGPIQEAAAPTPKQDPH